MGLNKRLISAASAGGGLGESTDNFDIVTYTGSNQESSRSITSLNFQPDLIISKVRNDSWPFFVYDSVRGAGLEKELQTSSSDAEGDYNNQAYGYLSSFDSNGFTSGVGTASPYDNQYFNKSGATFATWCFKGGGAAVSNTDGTLTADVSANPAAGFSIVKFTNTSNTQTIGHGLDSKPELVIQKRIDSTSDWYVRTDIIDGSDDFLRLNTLDAKANNTNFGHNNTTFNAWQGAANWICYCFHSVDEYQKVGTFTGDGNSSKTITTGFQPRFILLKLETGGHWFVYDSERPTGEGTSEAFLINANTAALSNRDGVDFISNGFTIYDGDNFNTSNVKTLYLAIA